MSKDEKKWQTSLEAASAFEKSSVFRSLVMGHDAMNAYDSTGLGAVVKAIDATAVNRLAGGLDFKHMQEFDSGIGSAIRALTESNALFSERIHAALSRQDIVFSDLIQRYREPALGIQKALEAYRTSLSMDGMQIGAALNNLDFSRIGSAFDQLSVGGAIGSEFSAISKQMAEQVSAFRLPDAPKLNFDLSSNIGDLLARSLAAQEALLEEQRAYNETQTEAADADKVEKRFHRRNAYFQTLIAVLSLFLLIAISWDELLEAGGLVEAKPDTFLQMREALVSMSEQLEALQVADEESADREEAEAKREAAADADLASIMREIADGLKNNEVETE